MTSLPKINQLVLCLLVILAAVINYYPLPFFTGSALIFGNVIAVAVTLVSGLRAGLITAVLAGCITYFNWQHLLVLPPFVIEVLVVQWAYRTERSPVFWGMMYWFSAGWLIVATEYFLLTNYLDLTKVAIVIKYVVNGSLNIMLGYLLAISLNRIFRAERLPALKLSSFITLSIFYAVTFSVLANTYYWLRIHQDNKLDQLQSQLKLEATHVAIEMEDFVFSGLSSIQLLTELDNKNQAVNTSGKLNQIANHNPSFLTMLLTDKRGVIKTAYPNELMDKLPSGYSVGHRDYFTEPKSTLKPYISDVFMGQGFGNDPIVAVAAPFVSDGEFLGIVEASLDLSSFKQLDRRLIDKGQGLIILDDSKKVIYSSEHLGLAFLQDLNDSEWMRYLENSFNYYMLTEQGQYQIAQIKKSEKLGWSVIATVPRESYEAQISSNIIVSLLLLVVFVLVFFYAAARLAVYVSQPITNLANKISWASHNKKFEYIELNLKSTLIAELNDMAPIIQRFARKLKKTLNQLHDANIETRQANDELAKLNANLSNLVEEKTEALQLALKDATQANKAKSSFLATMSHEIRTPMNGVLGMLEILKLSDLNELQKENVEVAESSARALLGLINDILDFSKLDAGKMVFERVDFDLISLIQEVVDVHQFILQSEDVTLVFKKPEQQELWLIGDPNRIRQVITNLLSNAIKFTQKGKVEVDCHFKTDKSLFKVSIQVADTGIGIEPKKLKQLFNPFTQADASTTREYGGTGLGLSIAKQLCNLMGGDIVAVSSAGEGSVFTANMLLAKGFARHDKVGTVIDVSAHKNGLSVLVVEDNLVNQTVAKKMLTSLGCNVEIASNGTESLEWLNKTEKSFDLVLMDCQMPQMDGFEATTQIRNGKVLDKYKRIPIIALTANAMKGDKERCLEVGMDQFLTKPISLEKLKAALAKC